MTAAIVFTVFANSYSQLMPAIAHDTLNVGALHLSWMASAAGLGGLVGALVITTMAGWPRLGWLIIADAFLIGMLLVVLGAQRSLLPVLVVAMLGCATVTYQGATGNIVQLTVPNALRGRVLGLLTMEFQTGTQAGTLLLGSLGSLVGISNALIGAGFMILVTSVLMSRVPVIRGVEASKIAVADT